MYYKQKSKRHLIMNLKETLIENYILVAALNLDLQRKY